MFTNLHKYTSKIQDTLFVIVLYRCSLEESKAYQALSRSGSGVEKEDIYVHDNSVDNLYLAKAYNKALKEAKRRGKKRLVLLDQDTEVTEEYLKAISLIHTDDGHTIWVPELVNEKGKRISPYGYKSNFGPWWNKHMRPKKDDRVIGFNSGMVLGVNQLECIGGFNEEYPLDYLDFDTCKRLEDKGVAISELGVRMTHHLSVQDPHKYVSFERYEILLAAERRFAQSLGKSAEKAYRCRLFLRAVRWTITRHKWWKETWMALRKKEYIKIYEKVRRHYPYCTPK